MLGCNEWQDGTVGYDLIGDTQDKTHLFLPLCYRKVGGPPSFPAPPSSPLTFLISPDVSPYVAAIIVRTVVALRGLWLRHTSEARLDPPPRKLLCR